jgi:hypothetical protein
MTITWEPLPENFVLPDYPVDNINQPALAAALTESLELAGRLPATALTPTNYGICATVDGQTIVKAPDWAYIPAIRVPRSTILISYTPELHGEPLAVVIEFVSVTDGGEYSLTPRYPYGKWFFYEQILQVPFYAIFEPRSGDLEVYALTAGEYRRQGVNEAGRYWIEPLNLSLAAWQGERENRLGYWLRWWDGAGNCLPWRSELVATERERAETEKARADRLAARLRELGLDPETDA